MQHTQLPEYIKRISPETTFSFSCHKGVRCFTECCRLLELALTPYDVLRLRIGKGMHSEKLLDSSIIIEQDPDEPFPRFYLTMVDDGRASCIFVNESGCSVYEHRPAACRTYPLGRAVVKKAANDLDEHYVLIREAHCLGFDEKDQQNIMKYSREQGLGAYNRFNDRVAFILQHESIRNGVIPSPRQADLYTLALYNIDSFREKLFSNRIASAHLTVREQERLLDDEQLLDFAIKWLYRELYGSPLNI